MFTLKTGGPDPDAPPPKSAPGHAGHWFQFTGIQTLYKLLRFQTHACSNSRHELICEYCHARVILWPVV